MFKEREAHAAELKAVRAKHDAELTKVEEAHRMELSELSAKLENESSEVKEARDTIDALRGSPATPASASAISLEMVGMYRYSMPTQ